jgi:hypothetical protein
MFCISEKRKQKKKNRTYVYIVLEKVCGKEINVLVYVCGVYVYVGLSCAESLEIY